jgi:hypothetical protein
MTWKRVYYKGMETDLIINEQAVVKNTNTGNFLKPYFSKSTGYMLITIPKIRKKYRLHRMVAEAFIENPYDYPYVNHKDGDKTHNSVDNLEWVTAQMNSRHAEDHHLVNHARGEAAGKNKYSEKLIRRACEMLEEGIPTTHIAKELGMSRRLVNSLKFGEVWKHVIKDYDIPKTKRKSYKELNKYVDTFIILGFKRRAIVKILLQVLDSKKLAIAITDRRIHEHRRHKKWEEEKYGI